MKAVMKRNMVLPGIAALLIMTVCAGCNVDGSSSDDKSPYQRTYYIDESGDDANTGSAANNPLATLSEALIRVKEDKAEDASIEAVEIIVSGRIEELSRQTNGMVEIAGDGYPAITIRGKGKEDAEGIIDATGQHRTLYIDGGNTVILGNNLTITEGNPGLGVSYGGGILVSGANTSLTLDGGIIKKNHTAQAGYGGAIALLDGAAFTLSSGDIGGQGTIQGGGGENNNAGTGGAIYVGTDSVFTMNGGSIFGSNSNTHDGGGAIFIAAGGSFTLNGGIIHHNNAYGVGSSGGGGGVYVAAGAVFTMTGGEISSNQAEPNTTGGGGVYVQGKAGTAETGGTFILGGGLIKDNIGLNGPGVLVGSTSMGSGIFILKGDGMVHKNNPVALTRSSSSQAFVSIGGELGGSGPVAKIELLDQGAGWTPGMTVLSIADTWAEGTVASIADRITLGAHRSSGLNGLPYSYTIDGEGKLASTDRP
jgi:hypothetical protein